MQVGPVGGRMPSPTIKDFPHTGSMNHEIMHWTGPLADCITNHHEKNEIKIFGFRVGFFFFSYRLMDF